MKTICLVEISNGGHREAFMQLFAKALIQTGNRVICIMPDTSEVKNWVEKNHPEFNPHIQYYSLFYPHDNTTKFTKWTLFKRFVSIWRYYKNELRRIEKLSNSRFDLVFWNCLDGFVSNYFPSFAADFIFPYKWSGLYFHPNFLRTRPFLLDKKPGISDLDNCLQANKCVAVTIHDEGVIEGFQKRLNKKVLLFPEIADCTLPDANNIMAKEIQQKANGRMVVGTIGLETFKGCYEFMRLAKAADPNRFFFVFTGIWDDAWLSSFSSEAQAKGFGDFKNNLPENCYWKTGRLTEGAEYNTIFCAFDVIWLVYKNFYSSSNRLTKASYFHKLVLSGNKYCVGEDVIRYNLGETVENMDDSTLLAALEKLYDRQQQKDFPVENWKTYSGKHSEVILKEKFKEILDLL